MGKHSILFLLAWLLYSPFARAGTADAAFQETFYEFSGFRNVRGRPAAISLYRGTLAVSGPFGTISNDVNTLNYCTWGRFKAELTQGPVPMLLNIIYPQPNWSAAIVPERAELTVGNEILARTLSASPASDFTYAAHPDNTNSCNLLSSVSFHDFVFARSPTPLSPGASVIVNGELHRQEKVSIEDLLLMERLGLGGRTPLAGKITTSGEFTILDVDGKIDCNLPGPRHPRQPPPPHVFNYRPWSGQLRFLSDDVSTVEMINFVDADCSP